MATNKGYKGPVLAKNADAGLTREEMFDQKELTDDEIQAEVQRFEKMIKSLENFLALYEEYQSGNYKNAIKIKAQQVNFVDNSGKVRDFVTRYIHNRKLMKAVFYKSDRAPRLIYIHDTIYHDDGTQAIESEILAKAANFKQSIENALATNKFDVRTWRQLYDAGELDVGFGVAANLKKKEETMQNIEDNNNNTKGGQNNNQNSQNLESNSKSEAQVPKQRSPREFGPSGWASVCGKLAGISDKILMMRTDAGERKNDDEVVAMSNSEIHRFDQGYYIEVEVAGVDDAISGCMGLGVTTVAPENMGTSLPKRLEKFQQGWFFTGPYKGGTTRRVYRHGKNYKCIGPYKGGTTRRVYRHGKKDIRFILDGEENHPLRWSAGDKMSLLVRPKDWTAENWQWTISLYINRNIVLACTIDVSPDEDTGKIPRELKLYACVEAYGYVNGVRLRRDGTPQGLAIAGLKKDDNVQGGGNVQSSESVE